MLLRDYSVCMLVYVYDAMMITTATACVNDDLMCRAVARAYGFMGYDDGYVTMM